MHALLDAISLVGISLAGVCTHIHTCVGKDALRSVVRDCERSGTMSVSSVREGSTHQQHIHTMEYYVSMPKPVAADCRKDYQATLK